MVPSPHAGRESPLVIVADDDAALCAALKFSLEVEGYRVATYDSGEALLQDALPPEGACLVVDERLPGISGLEALSQLRRRGVGLPAFLITTNPLRSTRRRAEALGVAIVEKPLLGDALLDPIRAALPA